MKCRMDQKQLDVLASFIDVKIRMAQKRTFNSVTPLDLDLEAVADKEFEETFLHEGYESDGGNGKSPGWVIPQGDPRVNEVDSK